MILLWPLIGLIFCVGIRRSLHAKISLAEYILIILCTPVLSICYVVYLLASISL